MQKTIEKENYLKAVYKMAEKSQKVSVTSISKHFNVSKSTVSNMIKKLVVMNLIDSKPYEPIILTKNGKKAAVEIIAKHRLIEPVSYTHLTLPTKARCRSRWSPYH